MSKLIHNNSSFLRLLLETTSAQAYCLLTTITPAQALSLSEISLNLLTLPLSSRQKRIVKKEEKILKKLSQKSLKSNLRLKLIAKKKKDIYKVLIHFKEPLLKLL